jgi:hypothetical protein
MKYSVNKKNGGISIRGHYIDDYKEQNVFQTYIKNRTFIQSVTSESSSVLDDMPVNEFYLVLKNAFEIKKENIELQAKMIPNLSLAAV